MGSSATQFKPGDAVFGTARGTFAEYACAPESTIALKPGNVTFAHAAAVPIAGLHGTAGSSRYCPSSAGATSADQRRGRRRRHVRRTNRKILRGRSHRRLQYAEISKWSDRSVRTTSSTTPPRPTSPGAGSNTTFSSTASVNHSLSEYCRVLTPGGIYVGVGGGGPEVGSFPLIAGMIKKPVLSLFVKQKLRGLLAKANREDLAILGDMINAGKITPVIDRRFTLSEVADAIRYVETGHARGKVVIIPE